MGFERLVPALLLVFGMLAGGAALAAVEAPQAQVPDLAILIVGDETKAPMLRDEKALIAEMTRLITGKGESEAEGDRYAHVRDLQVYSYHFNQAREKQYCEKRLNILAEDLLFVGVVELKDRLPRRVLYRLDRIVTPRRAATDVLTRAEEMLAPASPEAEASPSPQVSPSPSASPAVRPVSSPSPAPAAGGPPVATITPPVTPAAAPVQAAGSSAWRIQLGSYADLKNAQDRVAQLKEKGHESRIEHSSRNGANLFRVYVGSFAGRQGAQATLDRLKKDGFTEAFLVAPDAP